MPIFSNLAIFYKTLKTVIIVREMPRIYHEHRIKRKQLTEINKKEADVNYWNFHVKKMHAKYRLYFL